MHLDLKPHHLAMLSRSSEMETFTVGYSEDQALLMTQAGWKELSPREYLLVMALLRQYQRWKAEAEAAPFGLSLQQLMALVKEASPAAVEKALRRARLKVCELGIYLYPLPGERRWFVLLAADLGKSIPA